MMRTTEELTGDLSERGAIWPIAMARCVCISVRVRGVMDEGARADDADHRGAEGGLGRAGGDLAAGYGCVSHLGMC